LVLGCAVAFAFLFAACGGSNNGGGGDYIGSCAMTSGTGCQDWYCAAGSCSGIAPTAEQECTNSGDSTWSTTTCPSGEVGTCTITAGGLVSDIHYSEGTAAQRQQGCSMAGGTWQ
jgi:hypothetical protein